MIWWDREFWSTWLAWWVDGCPPPQTWYSVRRMQQGFDRLAYIIGQSLGPTIEKATASVVAFMRAYQEVPR